MKFVYKTVPLKNVDLRDQTYHYTDNRYNKEALTALIKANGVINPPLLTKKKTHFKVITGWRRIEIAKRLGFEEVPALVTRPGRITLDAAFKLSIFENQNQRGLNLFEKANALFRLKKAKVPEEIIVEEFMPMLGLAPSKSVKEETLAVLKLPEPLLEFVLSKNLSLKRIKSLKELPLTSLGLLAKVVENIEPSVSVFEELATRLTEIAKRDDQTLEDVARRLGILKILEDSARPKQKRLELIRRVVFKERYPTLAKRNQKMEAKIKKLKLPTAVKIDWDRTLEKKEVIVELQASNPKQLKEALGRLRQQDFKKAVEEILGDL